MIKIIIDNDNDILYNSLSNITSQYEEKIEILYVPKDKLKTFFSRIKPKEPLVILDSNTSIAFYNNILKNIVSRRMDKSNIIILVIDLKTINTIINQEKSQLFIRRKEQSDFFLIQFVNAISDTIKDTLEIEQTVDNILWKLGFVASFKGTIYLKEAILLAYSDNKLLQDINVLVEKVSVKNKVENSKVVRSTMDKSLNSVLNYLHIDVIYEVFGDDYDGRKISVKYFIDLCIRHLEKNKKLCLNY